MLGAFVGTILGILFLTAIFVMVGAVFTFGWNLVFPATSISMFQGLIAVLLAWIAFKPAK
jgi:hypothetical protein